MAHASGYPLQGRTLFQGLRISIENRLGSYRVDKHHSPPKWRSKMWCDYGYILSSEGTDGDHIDAFVGSNAEAPYVYIVRQVNPRNGSFDEQKFMLGFDSMASAKAMYLRHYDTPKFFGGITRMPMGEFRRKALASLHGSRLIKGMVAGHFITTHGGKRVWVAPYEDTRVLAHRPAGEQKPRKGDSGTLFPEIGIVRPLPQRIAPKPPPPAVHQMSLFGSEKSIDEMTGQLARPAWWAIAQNENRMPDDEPVFWMDNGARAQLKSAAFAAALRVDPSPVAAMSDSARRFHQALLLANACFGGKVGMENLAPCLQAIGMEPIEFRFALRALRDDLQGERNQRMAAPVEEVPI